LSKRALRQAQGAEIESVVNVLVPDRATALDAARIKSEHHIAYADSFAAATAVRQSAPLWTGDPELLVPGAAWRPFDPSHP
jgi:predicted nucleic acid-binding protein